MSRHVGSNFDDFLNEEGVLEEVELVAAKRVVLFQLENTTIVLSKLTEVIKPIDD